MAHREPVRSSRPLACGLARLSGPLDCTSLVSAFIPSRCGRIPDGLARPIQARAYRYWHPVLRPSRWSHQVVVQNLALRPTPQEGAAALGTEMRDGFSMTCFDPCESPRAGAPAHGANQAHRYERSYRENLPHQLPLLRIPLLDDQVIRPGTFAATLVRASCIRRAATPTA